MQQVLFPFSGNSILIQQHNIRKQLLLFDKIAFINGYERLNLVKDEMFLLASQTKNGVNYLNSFFNDMDTLQEHGKIENIKVNLSELLKDPTVKTMAEQIIYFDQYAKVNENDLESLTSDDHYRLIMGNYYKNDLINRFVAYHLNTYLNIRTVPLIGTIENPLEATIKEDIKSEALLVTLQKLPIIDDSIPINEVLDYKNSDETKLEYFKLLNWLNSIQRDNFNQAEFNDHIQYLIYEYEHNLKLHKLKYRYANLNIAVNCFATVLENLIKIKFSDVANSIFSLQTKKVEMIQEEKNLRASEVSYIVNAKKHFT